MTGFWQIFTDIFQIFEWAAIYYVAGITAVYLGMTILGFFVLRRVTPVLTKDEASELARSPLVPGVSILAPAYNEALTVRESVRGMLKLAYSNYEVIVINDGSKDETLQILIDEFKLCRCNRTPSSEIPTKTIRGVYESRDPIRLLVIDKENGGKADSLNAGLNYARTPLVAAVDSDSLIEETALMQVVYPFLEDPDRMVASGGLIRIVNGCSVQGGRVTRVAVPRAWIPRFQTIEYLRAFLAGRVSFSFVNSLLIISGAFGIFQRKPVVELGGYLTTTVGEDMELVIRLHRYFQNRKIPYRIAFVPEPVCWTESPEDLKILRRQRNRWQRGTVECLRLHRSMIFNWKYGAVGLFALPYFLIFEMFGPAVELAGYGLTVIGLALGLIPINVAALFFIVSVLFGVVLSVSALLLEEFTVRRYQRPEDLLVLFASAIAENFGYRQLMTVWRTQGLWDAFRGKTGWGKMERKGFQT